MEDSIRPIQHPIEGLMVLLGGECSVQSATAIGQIIRLDAHGGAVRLMRVIVFLEGEQNFSFDIIKFGILGFGAAKLTQGRRIISLLKQLERERLGLRHRDGMEADLPLGGQLQRLFIGQIKLNELLLRLGLLF